MSKLDVAAGALSGVLLVLAFPPVGFFPLVFVALVPLLARVRATRGNRVGWAFFVFGVVSFWIGLFWLRTVLTPLGPGLLGLLLTLIFVWPTGHAAGFLVRRRVSLLVAAPVAFLLSEWLRTWLFTGFPWLYLSHPLAHCRLLVQIADVTGAYGLTLLVALGNAALVEAWFRLRSRRSLKALVPLAWPVALSAVFLVYGAVRESSIRVEPGPHVLVVEGDIPQLEKKQVWSGETLAEHMLRQHVLLTREGVRRDPETDFVVWPETMFPYLVPGPRPDLTDEKLGEVVAAAGGRPVIIGALSGTGESDMRNSVFLLRRGGVVRGRYDKIHLVPGGEYIPLRTIAPRWLLTWVGKRIEASAGFVPNLTEGDRLVLFRVAGLRVAPLVCYETCYPGLVRAAVGAGADALLNVSNYGWFPGTSEPSQAIEYLIYRAVEARRPLVMAANTGISGIIGPTGKVERLVVDGRSEDVAGTFDGAIPLTRAASFYVRVGDWLPLAAAVLLAIVACLRVASWLRSRGRSLDPPPFSA